MNGAEGESDALVIRDQMRNILETVPIVPKVGRLKTLLNGCEYREGHEDDDEDEEMEDSLDGRPVSPVFNP